MARFAAVLAAAIALTLNIAATIQLFAPQTTFGYQLVYSKGFEVAEVNPGSPAARAGVVAGDYLDFRNSNFHDRLVGLLYVAARPNELIHFVLVHQNQRRPAAMRAAPLTPSQSSRALLSPLASFIRLVGFAYIAIAAIILLRRPNRMTYGLFFYLISATDVTLYRFPDAIFPFVQLGSDLLDIAGPIGLVVFAARFPEDRPTGWRIWLDRLALPIGALFAIPNIGWDVTALSAGESPAAWMSHGATLGALALILVAVVTLIAAYVAAQPSQRQRFQWVIAGVLLTVLSYAAAWARYWAPTYSIASSDALVWTATILYAFAPFAIAYAVVRDRVFDISFVVSRTLVYTIVSAAIFGFFALIEWLTGRLIEHTGIAIALVALAAIAVSFSVEKIYARVEDLIEGTIFRRRRQAERRLAEVAAGLPLAPNAAAVEDALMREPVRSLALSSANLFRRDDSGEFLDDDRPLNRSIPLQLLGRRRALRLHDGDAVLAVPVFVRSRLEAIAVYGAHANGEDIDPDEAQSLDAIGAAAGTAYAHLEMARVERDLERWQRVAERQARELALLRERLSLLGEHLAGDDAHGDRTV